MKFSEKYELLQTLTTGAVETFVANDKIRGERVLVHIVECPAQKADQTTAEWVLESFRRQAPEPPGPVLETGKYSSPKYGYVVIKPGEETTVKAWVRRYELQADETKETAAHLVQAPVHTNPPREVANPATKEPTATPGSTTQLFRDFDSLVKSKAPEASTSAEVSAAKISPSTSLLEESGLHAATAWDPRSAKPAAVPNEPSFDAPVPPRPASPEPSPVAPQMGKPGEFTSFFQGPFQGDKASGMPSYSSQPIEPPKKTVGEFTALFGQSSPPVPSPAVPSSSSEPSFTSIFKDMRPAQPTYNATPAIQGGVIPAESQASPTGPPAGAVPLPDPVFVTPTPTPVSPAIPVKTSTSAQNLPVERPAPVRSGSLPGDGATGAFMRPSADPVPPPREEPSGPSPYTQIISRPKAVEAEDAATGRAAADAGQFRAPSMPKIPAAAPPPMPRAPQPPRVAPPAVSKMKAPQPPKAPKLDAPAPPPVSMWPLIITLTVLFFLAVILVLFFVLRH